MGWLVGRSVGRSLGWWLVSWLALILPTVKQNFDYFFVFIWGGGASLGRTESINEVKRVMNSLCNVQKLEQVKPKMMFLVFFYTVVLLAFLLL